MQSSVHGYEHGEAQATCPGSRSRDICAFSSMSVAECRHRSRFWLELDGDHEPFTCPPSGPSGRACQPDSGASACGRGKFRIVRPNRFEDRDMRIEGDPVSAGIAERHASLVDQPIDDSPGARPHRWDSWDRCDRVVKRDIRVLKARTCSSHQAHRSGGGHPLLWRCALRHAPSRPSNRARAAAHH
jgi:hypothetical protein